MGYHTAKSKIIKTKTISFNPLAKPMYTGLIQGKIIYPSAMPIFIKDGFFLLLTFFLLAFLGGVGGSCQPHARARVCKIIALLFS